MSDVQSDCEVKVAKLVRKLSDKDTVVLISEVRCRECLWNNNHQGFKNTAETRKLWDEVGAKINLSGEEAKCKWKNLKDKFRKTFQNNLAKISRRPIRAVPKWKFYESMMFCKDTLPSRMTDTLTLAEECSFERITVAPDLQEEYEDVKDVASVDVKTNPQPLQQLETSFNPADRNDLQIPRTHRTRFARNKKQRNANKLKALKKMRLEAKVKLQQHDQDDDYHFFMSLVPYVRVLDPIDKLQVRSIIQSTVLEAYKNHDLKRQNDFRSLSVSSISSPSNCEDLIM